MPERILIVGASGFLGQRVHSGFPELSALGTAFKNVTDGLASVDLRDPAPILSYISDTQPDRVIYAAAISNTEQCERDQDEARRVNVATPAAIASQITCPLTYISTDYVFDGSRGEYSEDCTTNPKSYYGKTKAAGERAVLSANDRNSVLRVSGLFSDTATSAGLLSAAERARVDVISAPLHLDDAVSAVRVLVRNRLRGVFHAAGPTAMTRYDFLQLSRLRFREAPDVFPETCSDDQLRPANSVLLCNKLCASGWSARRPVVVFLPPTFHCDGQHLTALAGPRQQVIGIGCVGALLTERAFASRKQFASDHDQKSRGNQEPDFSAINRERLTERYTINPGLWRTIIALRLAGYRLIAVDDMVPADFARWRDRLGLDIWFHGTTSSVESGVEKTSSAFFSALANRLSVSASSFVIMDSGPAVCSAAKGAGMETHLTEVERTGCLNSFVLKRLQIDQKIDESKVAHTNVNEIANPDARFFEQMRIHSSIFQRRNHRDYFMLSSGTNMLAPWWRWPDLLALEVEQQLAQSWYTAASGFPLLCHSAALYENSAALGQIDYGRRTIGRSVAMTFGASQGLALVYEYLSAAYATPTMLVVEPIYPIAYRLAAKSRIRVISVCASDECATRMRPSAQQIIATIEEHLPNALLLATPFNPSGETFQDDEIVAIVEACARHDTLLIVDRVGELVSDIPVTRMMAQSDCWRSGRLQVVVVNSISKSEGLPGFRMGYVIGPRTITEFVASQQLHGAMNPHTVPALPVFLTFVLRCALIDGAERGLNSFARYARLMFRTTTAVAPEKIIASVVRLLDTSFEELVDSYSLHHKQIAQNIASNEKLAHNVLGHSIIRKTSRRAGLNMAVVLSDSIGRAEQDYCRRSIEGSAVAVVTESCFRLTRPQRPWYWTRISLAAPNEQFQTACRRFAAWGERDT